MDRPAHILTDIEGTTTPIAFVREVLVPYARERLPGLLQHEARPDVAEQVAEIARMVPGCSPIEVVMAWMDADEKAAPLKKLQGMVWREGYEAGALAGTLYPDVAPALRRWRGAGIRLSVFSSGSVLAQQLLFRHSAAGNLTPLFDGFFDTEVGGKRERSSYASICSGNPRGWLFLSDVEEELTAAAASGMDVVQLVHEADGTRPSSRYAHACDFDEVEAGWRG